MMTTCTAHQSVAAYWATCDGTAKIEYFDWFLSHGKLTEYRLLRFESQTINVFLIYLFEKFCFVKLISLIKCFQIRRNKYI